MAESKSRKQVFIDYYTQDDYEDTLVRLPGIAQQAERRAMEELEPRIDERRAVMAFIKNFIKEKKRKVYGGTAVNELIKAKNPGDAIYSDYCFSDIEFYSPTPVLDLIELCNALHKNGFKYVQGQGAQHEGSYKIHVNFILYCDISHCPTNVYHGIKSIPIDGINYNDPHFIWIDQLRMFTAPMTAYNIWEKNFKRSFLLLKHYPPEYFDRPININKPTDDISILFQKIKKEFLTRTDISGITLLGGFDAYNFYIRHATGTANREELLGGGPKYETNVPFIELFSVNYQDTVIALHAFIKKIVPNVDLITLEENYPLFQFTGYSITIKYNDKPLVKVYDRDNYCIPDVKVKIGIRYVSYQYVVMTFLMHKFQCHLNKQKEMYFNYGVAISNLIQVRNMYLDKNKLLVINDTIFSEFRTICIGSTTSVLREGFLRKMEKTSKGKKITHFRYSPEDFFGQSDEDQKKNFEKMIKFDHGGFANTSGNTIKYPKNMRFKLNEQLDLVVGLDKETASESETEVETETEIGTETESGTGTGTESKPESKTETESGNESKTETETEIETKI